jgi:hypothetical protein
LAAPPAAAPAAAPSNAPVAVLMTISLVKKLLEPLNAVRWLAQGSAGSTVRLPSPIPNISGTFSICAQPDSIRQHPASMATRRRASSIINSDQSVTALWWSHGRPNTPVPSHKCLNIFARGPKLAIVKAPSGDGSSTCVRPRDNAPKRQ